MIEHDYHYEDEEPAYRRRASTLYSRRLKEYRHRTGLSPQDPDYLDPNEFEEPEEPDF